MIIKKLLNSIEINKITVLMIFLCTITGLFKEIIAIGILLIMHEFGHFITAKIFNWNVKKIIFYPFGGLIIFEEKIDKPLYQEFLITIMGPIFQCLTYLIIYFFYTKCYVSEYFYLIAKNYNFSILLFNLIPIIPLDGSKILNIILNKFICFRKSYIFTIYISLIMLILVIFYIRNDISYLFLIMFLIYEIFISVKYRKYIFHKFILEKKLYKSEYNKYKKINNIKKMYRNKKHLFKRNNNYVTEKQMFKNIN